MHNRTKTVLASVGVAALIVVGTDAMTYAGTGDSLILGHGNKSTKTTHIKTTGNGPALSLHAKGKRPALAVDSNAKIVRLNADRVDGKHASGLRNNVRVYTATSGNADNGELVFQLPNFPKGRYQATYSVYMLSAFGTTANPTDAHCYFDESEPSLGVSGLTATTSTGSLVALSASDIINKSKSRWRLSCYASQRGVGPDTWSVSDDFPVRVTLTKIDKTIGGKLTATEPPEVRTLPGMARIQVQTS